MTFLYPGPGPWSGLFCPTPPTIPAIFQARCVPGTVLNTLSYFASISYKEDLMTHDSHIADKEIKAQGSLPTFVELCSW